MQRAIWEQRYGEREYAYGKAPNDFLKERLELLEPGVLLLPMEGEGRNAVFAARIGWEVRAFDLSEAGRQKAGRLAEAHGVAVRYDVCDLYDYPFPVSACDAVGLVFAHLPPEARRLLHQRSAAALKPGGHIILEAFSPRQIHRQSGGPRQPEWLYDAESIAGDFQDLETLLLREEQIVLDEGPCHQGVAEVIRYVGRRIP